MEYAKLLDEVIDAIVEGDMSSAPKLLRDKQDFPATKQLAAYAEGYRLRLAEAVTNAYPALEYYLGKAKFAPLVESYIAAHPSRYFNLDKYAIGFAPFVAVKNEDAFAHELAALEGTIHDVYQREETPPADAAWAAKQTMESLAAASLRLRAAAELLRLTYPVNDYLTAFRAGEKPGKSVQAEQWLLVLRHRNQVQRLVLEEAEFELLLLLAQGRTLTTALEDERFETFVTGQDFASRLTSWLSRWVSEGVLHLPEGI